MMPTPVEHLVVPTGTAAATVVATVPSEDPGIESRRFARIQALGQPAFRAHFEELIVQGVYTVLHGRMLVLRVIGGGVRSLALVCALPGTDATNSDRSGLWTVPSIIGLPVDRAEELGLKELIESEARQRPIFHGVTGEGTTYSGFVVQQQRAMLEALASLALEGCSPAKLGVLVLGEPIEIPPGLLVAMDRATE
jgi:hypothetical protein